MTDLRSRILARLDQLERLAQSASAYGEHWAPDCQDVDGDHIDRVVGNGDEEDPTVIYADGRAINHIATWDPAAVLTLCANARDLVDSHTPVPFIRSRLVDQPDGTIRSERSTEYECSCVDRTDVLYPCDDLKTIARMLGVDPDGE